MSKKFLYEKVKISKLKLLEIFARGFGALKNKGF